MTIFDTSLPYDTPASYDPSAPPASNPPTRGDVWRYRFYQMQNGQPGFTSESFLFDLPVNTANFSSILQQTGQISGSIKATDESVKSALMNLDAPLHLLEEKTAIYVELNGSLVWGGILQQVNYDSMAQTINIRGMDWWGYFNQGRIISWNSSYTGADQLLVAADLINIAQGNASSTAQSPNIAAGYVVGGNVGVQLGTLASEALAGSYSSGIAITVGWAESSFKSIGQAISDMGTSAIGFDWTIDVAYNSNSVPTKTFNLWFPRAGRTAQTQLANGTEVVFDMGSTSGQSYQWTSGQVAPANVMFAAGSGSGNQAVASVASDPSLLNAGWPLLENSVSFTDVNSQALLDSLAESHLNSTKYPVSQIKVRYNLGSDSNAPLGTFALGDDCRLIIPPDPYFPNGYDSAGINAGESWWRVQQINSTVSDQGKSYMELVLGAPPIIPGY